MSRTLHYFPIVISLLHTVRGLSSTAPCQSVVCRWSGGEKVRRALGRNTSLYYLLLGEESIGQEYITLLLATFNSLWKLYLFKFSGSRQLHINLNTQHSQASPMCNFQILAVFVILPCEITQSYKYLYRLPTLQLLCHCDDCDDNSGQGFLISSQPSPAFCLFSTLKGRNGKTEVLRSPIVRH